MMSLLAGESGIRPDILVSLVKALSSPMRNPVIEWSTIFEFFFIFEMSKQGTDTAGVRLLKMLGLRNWALNGDCKIRIVEALELIDFSGGDYNLIEDPEPASGFDVGLGAVVVHMTSGRGRPKVEPVRVVIQLSTAEHVKAKLVTNAINMLVSACSFYVDAHVRTICVFAGPFFQWLEYSDEIREGVLLELQFCDKCVGEEREKAKEAKKEAKKDVSIANKKQQMKNQQRAGAQDSAPLTTCPRCLEKRARFGDVLRRIHSNRILRINSKPTPMRSTSLPFELFFIGRDDEFWESVPVYKLVKRHDLDATLKYFMSHVSLSAVVASFPPSCDARSPVLYGMSPTGYARLPEFPFSIAKLETDLLLYLDPETSGKVLPLLCSAEMTGLSLLKCSVLESNELVILGVKKESLVDVEEAVERYRMAMAFPLVVDLPRGNINAVVDLLRLWGTSHAASTIIRTFLEQFGASRLQDLALENMDQLKIPIGAKLAALYVLSPARRAITSSIPT